MAIFSSSPFGVNGKVAINAGVSRRPNHLNDCNPYDWTCIIEQTSTSSPYLAYSLIIRVISGLSLTCDDSAAFDIRYIDPNLELDVTLFSTMTEPYDVNFCFPVKELENDKLKLTPFVVSIPSIIKSISELDQVSSNSAKRPYTSMVRSKPSISRNIQPRPLRPIL